MKNHFTKNTFIAFLAIMFAVTVALAALTLFNNGKVGDVHAEGLYTKYAYGSEFTVPDLVDENGQIVVAEKILHYPNGKSYAKDSYVLDVVGEYVIEYRVKASAGQAARTVEEKFNVYDTVYSFNDNVSTAVYESNASALAHPDLGAGLKVSLYSQSIITFNETVDLSTLNGKSPISFYVVPKTVGTRDFNRLIVRLTDAENPENYVTFYAQTESDETYVSMQAGAAHQPMSGRLKWGGQWPVDQLQVGGTNKGQLADFSFTGKHTSNYFRLFNLQLNLDNKEVAIQSKKIIDLDDPNDFEEPWNGFTNDKVYISVGVEFVQNGTGDLVITDVHGVDLSAKHVSNNDAPVITVDTQGYTEENLPQAAVGVPYPIFNAKADSTVNRDGVITKVYYNYDDSAYRQDVQITDGAFTPNKAGRYTIVYTASDIYGLTSVKRVDVSCVKTAPKILLDVDTVDLPSSVTVGERVTVNTEFTAEGGSGKLTKTVKVLLGEEEITLKDGVFKPLKEGEYKIVYTATDYIENSQNAIYTVTATYGDKPVFDAEPVLYDYYLSDSTYSIEPYYAYDYANGKNVVATVAVKVGNVSVPVTDGKFKATTDKKIDVIKFEYNANGAVKTITRPLYKTKTDDGNGIDLLNYFALTGEMGTSIFEDAVKLSTETDSGATFINPLLAQGLKVKFDSILGESNFKNLTVTLKDSLNAAQKVSFVIGRGDATGSTVTINGATYSLKTTFDESSSFSVTYTNGYIDFCGYAKAKITSYDDGTKFIGFDSGYAYFTVDFGGVTDVSSIVVTNIWGYNVSVESLALFGDERKPVADFASDIGGTHELGSVITVPVGYAFDVIDANPNITMIVYDPDLNIVTAIDGTELNDVVPNKAYEIRLEKVGTYTVTMNITDATGNPTIVSREIVSEEIIEPVIVLGNKKTTASVGQEIKVASATATDSQGNGLTVYVYVFDAEGKFNRVENNAKFKVEYTGTYKVLYLAKDANGNVATAQYEVLVK